MSKRVSNKGRKSRKGMVFARSEPKQSKYGAKYCAKRALRKLTK